MSLYFQILSGAFILPFLLSFDKRVAFYRSWKYLFPSMILTMLLFIPWDVIFTRQGIWGFNEKYLSGIYIFSLPVEEWLFFMAVPYASVFTYDVVKAYFPKLKGKRAGYHTNRILMVLALAVVFLFNDRLYTLTTACLLFLLLVLHHWVWKKQWLTEFYVSYLLVLIPFMVVNGLLTGATIEGEIVWYNNSENMGLRLITIPVEDIFYGFSLILMNVTLYEYFRGKFSS